MGQIKINFLQNNGKDFYTSYSVLNLIAHGGSVCRAAQKRDDNFFSFYNRKILCLALTLYSGEKKPKGLFYF